MMESDVGVNGLPGAQPYNKGFSAQEFLLSLEDGLFEQRLQRIREIEALGFHAYGHKFDFTATIPDIVAKFGSKPAEELSTNDRVKFAGRIHTIRRMGKAAFAHLV